MSDKTARKKGSIQRVEIDAFLYASIYCPFCGQQVVENDGEELFEIDPCKHTLFIAHDEGFEYLSDRAAASLGVNSIDEAMEREESIDELTDLIKVPDSVKFAAYVGPPGGFGDYVGFATLDDE